MTWKKAHIWIRWWDSQANTCLSSVVMIWIFIAVPWMKAVNCDIHENENLANTDDWWINLHNQHSNHLMSQKVRTSLLLVANISTTTNTTVTIDRSPDPNAKINFTNVISSKLTWQRLKSMLVVDIVLHFLVVFLAHLQHIFKNFRSQLPSYLIHRLILKGFFKSLEKTSQYIFGPRNHINT